MKRINKGETIDETEVDEMIDETHSLVEYETKGRDREKERDDGERAMMTYWG